MKPPSKQPATWDELLPSELVSHIFRLAVLEGIEAGSTSVDSSALLFGRVSKRWRDIAYSTSALWTSVSVNVSRAVSIPRLVPGVRLWLLRAGSLPLSVRLTVSRASQNLLPQLALLTEAVLSFSPQIRDLTIWVTFELTKYPVRTTLGTHDYIVLGEGGFPILEMLDIDYPRDRSDTVLANILGTAPALRLLSVTDYPGTISSLPVPMARLQRLMWGPNEPPTTARDVIRRAPELEECRFWLASMVATVPSGNEIDIHRRLRRLHIGPVGFEQFLAGLTLPALTHLIFDGARPHHLHGPVPWPQQDVAAFLIRSRCTLEQLSLLDVDMTPQDLEACLELVSPTLRELCVNRGPDGLVGAALLARLTAPGADQGPKPRDVLCPRLERVRVRGGVLERDGYGTGMLDMLESRFYRDPAGMDGVVRLKSAIVAGTFGPRQRKRVDNLKKDGFDLHFTLEGNRYL